MSEFGPERKIRYRRVACPHCGNDITAKSIRDEQNASSASVSSKSFSQGMVKRLIGSL